MIFCGSSLWMFFYIRFSATCMSLMSVPPWEISFSHSLQIHQVETKTITTVKAVWIHSLNLHGFWRFYFSVCSLVFVSIEKIYQTLETVFHQLSKHVEFHQNYSAAYCIFNSPLTVWISRWNTVSCVWYITCILHMSYLQCVWWHLHLRGSVGELLVAPLFAFSLLAYDFVQRRHHTQYRFTPNKHVKLTHW